MEQDPRLKKLEDSALASAMLFAGFVLQKDGREGLPSLPAMDFADISDTAREIMREGETDPGVVQHALESLLLLLRDSEMRAGRDALTKIFNRGHMDETISLHLERMLRNEAQHGALIFIDLDGFKPINDIYGHAAGDAALIHAAETLHREVRQIDIVARMGGDEFAIFMMDAKEQQAAYLTQRLDDVFKSLSVDFEGKQLPIRASIGMTTISREQTLEEVYAAADVAMYEVKKSRPSARDVTPVAVHANPAPAFKVI